MANAEETKPNRGEVVSDIVAVGPDQESLEAWRARKHINVDDQVKLARLSHMRYQHPDLDEITRFLRDFGMTIAKRTDSQIWFKGYGPDHYVYHAIQGPKKFLGGTFLVESYNDLERASRLPGAGEIVELTDAPGKGLLVTLIDPEGYPVNLIFGQSEVKGEQAHPSLATNYEVDKPRLRQFKRFTPGPAAVHKLGHYGYCVKDLQTQLDFYLRNFNLVPTDYLYVKTPDEKRMEVGIFAHIDRGNDYVDHHCFFMMLGESSHVHHCSFEVHDYDTQMLGHKWLKKNGYSLAWGVGRHILGSQIFDYWWDTSGNMVEHYADGDQVNNKTPVAYNAAGDESLSIWGPDLPQGFVG